MGNSPRNPEGVGRWRFDRRAADRACEFIEGLLVLSQGQWADQPFRLLDWQRQAVRDLLGWKERSTGLRRYREAYIELGKANGKSPFAAAVGLTLLYLDGERGAEIYTIANDREQAAIVFGDAHKMVAAEPELWSRAVLQKRCIVHSQTGGIMRPFSRVTATKHGQRPHVLIFDELHEFQDRNLVEFLTRGTMKRQQPLTIYITTAGVGQESICWEKHDYALKVQAWNRGDHEAGIEDDRFYPMVFAAAQEDDWTDPNVWARANPALGILFKVEDLARECQKALNNPAEQNTFRRLHLNQWVGQNERAIDMRLWDRGDAPLRDLTGRPCFAGMDLSSKLDLTALVLLFPWEDGSYDVLPYFWIPRENMAERVRRDRAPYHLWAESGAVEVTDGNWVDQSAVRRKLLELRERYQVVEVGYDSWNATKLATELQDQDGFTMVELRQGYRTMSEPTKALLGLVADGKLRHAGHRALRWQADSLTLRRDPNDNLCPDKAKSTQRIDGIVAMLMALGRALVHGGQQQVELYV